METREFIKADNKRIRVDDVVGYESTTNDQTEYNQETSEVTVIGKYYNVEIAHIRGSAVIIAWIYCGGGDEGLAEQTRQLAFLDNIFKPKQL